MMDKLTGQKIAGRYLIYEMLGRGGMAEVYKVWDEQRATWLAMKLLREDLAQDVVFLRRFAREADTLAKLQHPNIVRFYGLEQDDTLAFILMDYIEGSNLRAEIYRQRGNGLETDTVIHYLRPMCSALNYAHREGVIHCDVKPGNVMLPAGGVALVSDFGIARAAEGSTTATMVGAGTPAYMAPEQVEGEPPSPQTDIYALGIVLYEMLTGGERPFTGEHAQTTGTTAEKVRWEQVYLEPASPRKFRKDIPRALEKVVMTCLAKDPQARYATPLDLLNQVEAAVGVDGHEPIPAPPPQPVPPPPTAPGAGMPPEPQPDNSAKNPARAAGGRRIPVWGWVGGVAVLAALILGGVAFGSGVSRPTPTATPSDTPTRTATNTPTATQTDTPTATVAATAQRPTVAPSNPVIATQAGATSAPAATAAPVTSAPPKPTTSNGGGCPFSCLPGFSPGTCGPTSTQVVCTVTVGSCTGYTDCAIKCNASFPGTDAQCWGHVNSNNVYHTDDGTCLCVDIVP